MGFHRAGFGIFLGDHGANVIVLIAKSLKGFDKDGNPYDVILNGDPLKVNFEAGERICVTLYDDIDDIDGDVDEVKTGVITLKSVDDLYELTHGHIHLKTKYGEFYVNHSYCHATLGQIQEIGDDTTDHKYIRTMSRDDMLKLVALYDDLKAQGRVVHEFALVGNCCS